MEIDKTVLLIYYWLKEHDLLQTCACLEKEYGKTMLTQEKPPCSLYTILQALSTMLHILSNREETLSTFMSSQHAVTAINGGIAESPKRKKKVKTPFFTPGEWVCPEMESTLLKVYERVYEDYEAYERDKILNQCIPLQCSSETQSEKNDNDTKTTENIEMITAESSKGDVNMFTSDSDSDSGVDLTKLTAAPDIANGVLNVVSGTLKKNASGIPSLATDFIEKRGKDEENTVINNVVNNDTHNTKGIAVATEIQVKKKKKKKKKVLMSVTPDIYNGEPNAVCKKQNDFVDKVIDGEDITEKKSNISNEGIEVKKKKRKNDISVGEENALEKYPDDASSEVREVKKKKKRSNSEDIPSSVNCVEKSPEDEAGEHKIIKKKKKKVKTSDYTDDLHNTINISTNNSKQNITEITPPSPIKKKKKKSEREGRENELASKVENEVETKRKDENYTNSQDENKLALNSLCGTLKKKKKKKNVAYG